MMNPMNTGEFLRLQAAKVRGDVTLGWVADQAGAMLPGLLLVLVAAPSVLPVPGVGNLTGTALVLMALAIWSGRRSWVLPSALANLKLSQSHAVRLLLGMAGLHDWAARHLRPRAPSWVGVRGWSWAAWPVAAMGVVIFLPIPLGNVLGAFSLVVLGLGQSMEDGLAVAVGWLLSAATLVYSALLAWAATLFGYEVWSRLSSWLSAGVGACITASWSV